MNQYTLSEKQIPSGMMHDWGDMGEPDGKAKYGVIGSKPPKARTVSMYKTTQNYSHVISVHILGCISILYQVPLYFTRGTFSGRRE